MKDLTLAFTIIIKGCIANKMTPEQMASQLNEHVQHEVKNLNIPDVIKSVCVDCLYYLTCNDKSRDKQICDNYDNEP